MDKHIADIINGQSTEDHIDEMLIDELYLEETWFQDAKRFAKSKSWAATLAKAGIAAATTVGLYKLYGRMTNPIESPRDTGSCDGGLKSFLAFLVGESFKIAEKETVKLAVRAATKLAVESTGNPYIGQIIGKLLRPALNELKRRAKAPTKAEIETAVKNAVDTFIPDDLTADQNLVRRRAYVEGVGVAAKQGGGNIKGEDAWKIFLDRQYKFGKQMRIPLCVLILMNSSELGHGGGAGEQLDGLNEKVLQKEFKRVLKHGYPNFRIA